ncbi:hypothetical protein AB0A77_24060 [Streptomyces varsoviensis]|uniref:hypothetical protein n=1 Tax=Streptomyces varsoviensis TaxID=67373 RepID=UPI0033DC70D7
MRTRILRFGLYADEEGLAWVRGLVGRAAGTRSARIVEADVVRAYPGGDLTTAEMYDFLADQWAIEHPGQDSGAREAVELRVRLVCSLRTWRAIRKAVLKGLCPEGLAPHTCHVPWCGA